ncbi:isochorismatase family cysteine hydrolase [Cellulosilyticum sp. ST5]|uniref:cysteine hydrolase family protein n=1 Tax=Cellulosilyticum sp. ST5 TaxID=3055805 RepID=UPI0039772E49
MKKVLIVVDMQNDFITGSLGTKEAEVIVPRVVKKIEDYKARGEMVFFTRDTHFEDYLTTQEGNKLPVEHCIKSTWGWELAEPIEKLVEAHTPVIDKLTFGSIALGEQIKVLNDKEAVEIELVGLCTDICVVSNAIVLKAYCPEIPLTVDASCCAGVTSETHTSALTTLKMCQVNVINEN